MSAPTSSVRRRRRALVGTLLLLALGIGATIGWLLTSESAFRWVVAQVQARVAGELTFGAISGRLLGPIAIEDISYRTEASAIRIEHIDVDWRPWALLRGRLHITHARVTGTAIELTDAPPRDQRAPWRLPMAIRIDAGALHKLTLRRGDHEWMTIDSADLAVAADEHDLEIAQLHIVSPHFTLTAQGALDTDEGIQLDWRVYLPDLPEVAGNGTLTGTLRQLRSVQRLTAPAPTAVETDIDLRRADPRFRLRATIPATTLDRVVSTWPAIGIAGQIEAHGTAADFLIDAKLLLDHQNERFHVDAQARRQLKDVTLTKLEARRPDANGYLRAKGRYTSGDTPASLALQLDWHDWHWPGLAAIPIASDGNARIEGTLADYRLQAQASFAGKALPENQLKLALRGDAKAVRIETLKLHTLAGVVSVQGALDRDPWRWNLRVHGDNLNPGTHGPEWTGQLAFDARVRGTISGARVRNELVLTRLGGTLRNQNVAGSARWITTGARHEIADAVLRVGGAELKANGDIAREWNLALQANIPNLAAFAPDASGSVQARARLKGARATPRVDIGLDATRARYERTEVKDLKATLRLDLANREPSDVDISAHAIRYGQRIVESVQLTGRGTVNDHRLMLRLRTPETTLAADFRGAYAERAWRGRIVSASLAADYGTWSLGEAAPLRITADGFGVGPLCLQASETGRACGEIDWSATGPGRARMQAQALPLAWLNPLLPASLQLHGTVETAVDARFDAKRPIDASANFTSTAASVTRTHGGEALDIERGSGLLTLNDQGLRAKLDIVLAREDVLGVDVTLPRFSTTAAAGAEQPLTGRVRARLASLGRIGMFLPDLEIPRGQLDIDYQIAGTLANPTLRGAATLSDASANVPALGIRVRKVRLHASADGGRALRLDGGLSSGPGDATLTGDVTFDDASAWRTNLRIDGQRLEVANISQAWMLASPSLRIAARPGWLRLEGGVDIPEAKLTPKKPQAPISPSPDVVLINAADAPLESRRDWSVETQVRIALGDKIEFDGFGLTGNIVGNLVAVDSTERITTARGELRIEKGKYEAYGRKLEIERGRLLFAGGPVDNPGIDARAVRRVEEITAGIAIGGTLKSPQLSLFSDPPLTESDTLSYLLFGRPLDSTSGAQGRALANAATALKLAGGERLAERLAARFGIEEVGIESGRTSEDAALVLGKYLSPRLYINYSIGLFEQVNVLRLRYQLTTHWALQVESGTYTGADFLYSIER